MAFRVDAIVKAVAIDQPAGAHFAVAFPRDSPKYVLVGKRYPPHLALGKFDFGRGWGIDDSLVDFLPFLFVLVSFVFFAL
jgi:hypothetical protein